MAWGCRSSVTGRTDISGLCSSCRAHHKKQYVFYSDQRRSLNGGLHKVYSADYCSCITAQAPLAVSVVVLDLLFYKYIHRHCLQDATVLELLVWWLVMAELISQAFKNLFFQCCVILLKCYGNLLNSAEFGLWTYFARCNGCKFPIN